VSYSTIQPFTILFHGTNEHQDRDPNQEVLHEMTKLLVGQPYEDYLVCDGPGAAPPLPDNSWKTWWKSWVVPQSPNPTPGLFNPYSLNKEPKWKAPPDQQTDNEIRDLFAPKRDEPPRPEEPGFVKALKAYYEATFRPAANQVTRFQGLIKGVGLDDNIRHAIYVVHTRLEKLDGGKFLAGTQPFTLNLLGWSRGAVTCIRAANWFADVYKKRVEINIFAFDPVPGGHLDLEDARRLGPQVKSYVSVLCLDDRREPFRPIDMTGPDRDRLTLKSFDIELALLPMPGVHSTPLFFGSNQGSKNGINLHGCAEVARYLAWKFLVDKKTRLRPDGDNPERNFTARSLCEKYSEMMLNRDQYATQDGETRFNTYVQSWSQGHKPIERDVHRDRAQYLRRGDGRFFLNEHHLTAFALTFPRLARMAGVVMDDLPSGPDQSLDQCPFTKKWLWLWQGGDAAHLPSDSRWVDKLRLKPADWNARSEPEWRSCLGKGYRLLWKSLVG